MSHTEKMREALRKIKYEAVSLADAQVIALEALPAPAAEVPEAMGDAEIRRVFLAHGFTVKEGEADLKPYVFQAAQALNAARDAQWQSTRLRAAQHSSDCSSNNRGVPELLGPCDCAARLRAAAVPEGAAKQIMDALRDGLSVCMSVSVCRDRKVVRDGVTLYAQTEEWCRWLESEVGPKIRAAADALAALQSAQPAAVSDEAIYAVWAQHCQTPGTTTRQLVCGFARAILALRPQAVPMTPASRAVIMATRTADGDADKWPEPWAYRRGWNDAEAHHGITAQGAREGV